MGKTHSKGLIKLHSLNIKGMNFKFYIGIDVSKKTFDVAVRDKDIQVSHFIFENNKTGIISFIKELKLSSECLICMEHTGIYTFQLLSHLHEKGIAIWLEQAVNIKRSLGLQRGKNDKVDSIRIAEYACRFHDKVVLWEPARFAIKKLQDLITLRNFTFCFH